MSVLEHALEGRAVFVEFPRGGVRDWVPAAETLIEEGLAAFAFPPDQLSLVGQALDLFGYRARIGVCGLSDAASVSAAVAAGAHFLTSPLASGALRAAAGEVPLLPGALTPGEVGAAVAAGWDAVQIVPCEAAMPDLGRALASWFDGVDLVAAGSLDRFLAEEWIAAGARALGLRHSVLLPEGPGAAASANDLDAVRQRCQSFQRLSFS